MRIDRNRIIVALFVVAITLPPLLHLARDLGRDEPAVIAGENRFAAAFPARADHDAFPAYMAAVNRWLSDRFGLRETYLAAYRSIRDELELGGEGGQAIVGRDGWLFLTISGMLDDLQGLDPPGADELDEYVASMKALAARAETPVFAVLVVPNKATVHADKLPLWARPAPAGRRAARLVPRLEAAGLDVIDVTPALQAAREDAPSPLYYRTDTHWTPAGAYTGYRHLMAELAKRGVDAPLVAEAALEMMPIEGFRGDLVPMIGSNRYDERPMGLEVRTPVPSTEEGHEGRAETGSVRIYRQDLPGAPTLLVSADSFIPHMLPFLRQSFSRIVVAQRASFALDPDLLAAWPSDVVLYQTVERNLRYPPTLAGD
jgi:hypothetical protein